jgi:hypothetical protein
MLSKKGGVLLLEKRGNLVSSATKEHTERYNHDTKSLRIQPRRQCLSNKQRGLEEGQPLRIPAK